MRKLVRNAPIFYFVFLLFETILSAVLPTYGYELIITNRIVWFSLSLLIQLGFAAISILKRSELTKAAIIVSQVLPLLALVRYYYIDSFISMVPYGLIGLLAFVSFLSCFAISFLKFVPRFFRKVFAVLNFILFFIALAMFFLEAIFGSIGEHSIVHEKISPNGSYSVSIEKADSGALGGATNVFVEELTSSVDIVYGRISKVSQLYSGEWGSHVSVAWKDDHTLLINGKVFPLSDKTFIPES